MNIQSGFEYVEIMLNKAKDHLGCYHVVIRLLYPEANEKLFENETMNDEILGSIIYQWIVFTEQIYQYCIIKLKIFGNVDVTLL